MENDWVEQRKAEKRGKGRKQWDEEKETEVAVFPNVTPLVWLIKFLSGMTIKEILWVIPIHLINTVQGFKTTQKYVIVWTRVQTQYQIT